MKGMETSTLIGLILVIVVILIVSIVVFSPSLAFGKTTEQKQGFEQFCIFWGLNSYAQGLGEQVDMGGKKQGVTEMCHAELGRSPMSDSDSEFYGTCVKCCKKEIVC
jgi:hypothetical protein